MTEHILQLADGRKLSYAIYGAEDAKPVLYFHGTPSSRLEPNIISDYGTPIEELLQRYNLKLIAVDRPGMGHSTFHEQLSLASFADDAAALQSALGIESCALLCWSGGGPYALAMANQHPHLISAVYIIAGFSASLGETDVFEKMGWNKMYFQTARKLPLVLKGTLSLIKHEEIESPIHQELYDLADADYAFLKQVAPMNHFLQHTLKEACRNGTAGPVQEAQLYFQPFPFSLQQIQIPVHFWWGTEDNTVVYEHAKRLERQVPNVTPHYKPGEGHVSIYINCMDDVLRTISAH